MPFDRNNMFISFPKQVLKTNVPQAKQPINRDTVSKHSTWRDHYVRAVFFIAVLLKGVGNLGIF